MTSIHTRQLLELEQAMTRFSSSLTIVVPQSPPNLHRENPGVSQDVGYNGKDHGPSTRRTCACHEANQPGTAQQVARYL